MKQIHYKLALAYKPWADESIPFLDIDKLEQLVSAMDAAAMTSVVPITVGPDDRHIRRCPHCQRLFKAKYAHRLYCSGAHRDAAYRARKQMREAPQELAS